MNKNSLTAEYNNLPEVVTTALTNCGVVQVRECARVSKILHAMFLSVYAVSRDNDLLLLGSIRKSNLNNTILNDLSSLPP